jgi:hypothetical protein
MYQTETLSEEMQIPRSKAAVPIISNVINMYFSDVLDSKTITVQESIDFTTYRMSPQFVQVYMIKPGLKNFLNIWFDGADKAGIYGGRAVESGSGANCYQTVGELKEAIQNALDQWNGKLSKST